MVVKKFVNCKLIAENAIVDDDLWVKDGVIVDPEPLFYTDRILPDEIVDCGGHYVAPGYIDLQINGDLCAIIS